MTGTVKSFSASSITLSGMISGKVFCFAILNPLVGHPRQFLLKIHNLLDLHQKPAVNFREVENLLDGEAGAQGVPDEEDAFGVGHAQFAADDIAREDVAVAIDFRADAPGFAVAAQAAAADLQ